MDPHKVTHSPQLVATEIKHVYTIAPQPNDFEPNRAPQRELAEYGLFVRRPTAEDNPRLQDAWRRSFRRSWLSDRRVFPAPITPTSSLRRHTRSRLRQIAPGFDSDNWAGCVIDGNWNTVIGSWVVPLVRVPQSTPIDVEGGWELATWIGIDGVSTDDVLQTGVSTQVAPSGAVTTWAWYEWFTSPPSGTSWTTFLTEFPYVAEQPIDFGVSPGDEVTATVQYTTDSDGAPAGSILFGNITTGENFSVILDPPTGAAMNGSTAEWVVERPSVIGGDGTLEVLELPMFATVTFNSALSCGVKGLGEPLANGNTVTMIDDYGNAITNELLGSDYVIVDYDVPSAIGLFDTVAFTIATGSDDLRADSALTAIISFGGGISQVIRLKQKGQAAWGNGSTTRVQFALTPPVTITSGTLPGSLLLTLIQGGSWPETPDNWNLQSIIISLEDSSGHLQPFLLQTSSGDPLNRFTGSNGSFMLSLA
jgi:hypothetical protein